MDREWARRSAATFTVRLPQFSGVRLELKFRRTKSSIITTQTVKNEIDRILTKDGTVVWKREG